MDKTDKLCIMMENVLAIECMCMSLQDSLESVLLYYNYSVLAEQVRHLLQGSRIQNEKSALVGFLTEVQNFSAALPLSGKGQMMHPRV